MMEYWFLFDDLIQDFIAGIWHKQAVALNSNQLSP